MFCLRNHDWRSFLPSFPSQHKRIWKHCITDSSYLCLQDSPSERYEVTLSAVLPHSLPGDMITTLHRVSSRRRQPSCPHVRSCPSVRMQSQSTEPAGNCSTLGMQDKCYLSSWSILTPAPPALIPGLVLGQGTHYPLPSCLPAVWRREKSTLREAQLLPGVLVF